MASSNAPRGFVLAKKVGSGANSTGVNNKSVRPYAAVVPSGLIPSNLFTGDPVYVDAAGTVAPLASGGEGKITGVFQGVSYVNADGDAKFAKNWTGGSTATDVKVFICDDPDQTYFVQADATCTAAAGWEGMSSRNVPVLQGAGGSTVTGLSSFQLDASAITVAGAQARIIRRAPWDEGIGSSAGATDAYPWWEVRLNYHVDNFITCTISVSS